MTNTVNLNGIPLPFDSLMSKYYEKIEDPVRTQRSYLMFESGIRAKETQRTYKIYLELFRNFAKI